MSLAPRSTQIDRDKYPSDPWILEMFEGWYDPCPIDYHEGDSDALDQYLWPDRTFVNPPYSNPLPFVQKAIASTQELGSMVVMLLKHDSSTEWFRLIHEAGGHIMMINGRLKHGTGRSAPFPSILVVFS